LVIDLPTHLAHAIATEIHRDTQAMARANPPLVDDTTLDHFRTCFVHLRT